MARVRTRAGVRVYTLDQIPYGTRVWMAKHMAESESRFLYWVPISISTRQGKELVEALDLLWGRGVGGQRWWHGPPPDEQGSRMPGIWVLLPND